jgi:uncharacterized protein
MELTPAEQWILANQYRILERLYPEEAEELRRAREAVRSGDPVLLAAYSGVPYVPDTLLSDAERDLVRAILSLFGALQSSYAKLENKERISEEDVGFGGFDAAQERAFRDFSDHLLRNDEEFASIARAQAVAAQPMLPAYRRMLDAWRIYGKSSTLSKVQMLYVLESRKEPSHD